MSTLVPWLGAAAVIFTGVAVGLGTVVLYRINPHTVLFSLGSFVVKGAGDERALDVLLAGHLHTGRVSFVNSWQAWHTLTQTQLPTIAFLAGQSLVAAGVGALAGVLLQQWGLAFLFAGCAAALPWLRIVGRIHGFRQRVTTELPDLMVILAAEGASNANWTSILESCGNFPGTTGTMLQRILSVAAEEKTALFTTPDRSGLLLRVWDLLDHVESLRIWQVVDRISMQGPHAYEALRHMAQVRLMEQSRNIKENANKMDNWLTVILMVFFFLPFLGMILAPLAIVLLEALQG